MGSVTPVVNHHSPFINVDKNSPECTRASMYLIFHLTRQVNTETLLAIQQFLSDMIGLRMAGASLLMKHNGNNVRADIDSEGQKIDAMRSYN